MPVKLARSYFLAAWRQSIRFIRRISVPTFQVMSRRICLPEPFTGLDHHFLTMADLASCVTPLRLSRCIGSTGILNLFPITYAFRPWLRGRLTLGGRTFPRKSWNFGDRDSHPVFRYSCPHNHFHAVHDAFQRHFTPHGTLLYHDFTEVKSSAASAAGLVPIIFGARPLD